MSTLSFESLCLKDEDCPSPTRPQGVEDEFDTDLESDGKSIELIPGFILHVCCCYCVLSIDNPEVKSFLVSKQNYKNEHNINTIVHYFVYKPGSI